MDNLALAQEHQVTPEKQELVPDSGIREKIQPPESLDEAKERVSSVSEHAATEAAVFAESILSGPEYESAQQPIIKATEASIQKTTQETVNALNAELASIDAGWDEASQVQIHALEQAGISKTQPINDNAIVQERTVQDEELAAIDAGWDEVSEPAAEAPVEQGLKTEETPVEQEDKKEETEEDKEKEKAEDKEKERFEKLEEITQKLDEIIVAFNKGGLRSSEDLIGRMKKLQRDGHPDKFASDERFAKLALLVGRFMSAIKGEDIRWNKARQQDLEKDFAALKKEFGINVQETAQASEAPAVQFFEKTQAASTSQTPEAMHRTPPSTQESQKTNEAKTESTFEAAEPKKKVENMGVDEYELYMMTNIKGREEELERLYAVPASQRTGEQQHDIDYMELTNGMERKSIEKRREEVKLKELEERAEELNKEIEEMVKSVPVSAPASTALELVGAETSGAMVLAGQDSEQQDALAQKRVQLAEVMTAIQSSQTRIAELGAAIAQLDRIRRRMQKPAAEQASAKQAEAAGTVETPSAAGAAASQESGAQQAGGFAAGGSAIEYDPNYKGETKKESDKGPDLFDVTLSAIHGNTAPLEQKISKAVDTISKL